MTFILTSFNLSNIDLSIIIAYLIFVVMLGFYFGKKHEDAEDYFLAGRTLTWPLIGFSLFASNISSTTLVGLSGAAYTWAGTDQRRPSKVSVMSRFRCRK